MSRHRNIRSMNITDGEFKCYVTRKNLEFLQPISEYDGYDDVYGHSVEDDYSISPSEAAFMYDREGSRNQQKIGAYFRTVKDIAEEDENEMEQTARLLKQSKHHLIIVNLQASNLSDTDKARLESCIENISDTVGSGFSRSQLVSAILKHNFNTEEALNELLESQPSGQQNVTGNADKGKICIYCTNHFHSLVGILLH